MSISLNWDLDSIFAGESQSVALANFLDNLTNDMAKFEAIIPPDALTPETQEVWVETINTLYELSARLRQASSFIEYLVSQDVKDDKALQLTGQVDQLLARLETNWTQMTAIFAQQKDNAWKVLVADPNLAPISFHLDEQRNLARQKMKPQLEALANELAADGYYAWGRLYSVISGNKEVLWESNRMSLGQLQSKFMDEPDRAVRQAAFKLFETTWADLAKSCALILNYQAGFRLTMYKHRAWESVLQEPLQDNRLTAETLAAMWGVVDAKSEKLRDYLIAKARLFDLEKLSWFDVAAPVGEMSQHFSYEEATDFIVDNLRPLNPDIADYCRMAIDQRWIEAENRPGKEAGAYCTNLPLSGQSRIFMTYSGSYNSILTLAHELGHGYHDWVMRDLPYGARLYTMSVGETASILNELVVQEAGLKATTNDRERLSLLGTKLDNAVNYLMNIRARFDFELAFFEQRAKKQLGVDELSALMVSAQKTAYKDGLAVYHPLFWASKLHFYDARDPFYNFPYTFGYLFGTGVYAHALAEGPAFRKRYQALLCDTGSMTTETLAKTHLGVDLTRPEFWETAIDRALAEVDEFVALVDKLD